MVAAVAPARLQTKECETQLEHEHEHIIFKICLQCHYNTLRHSGETLAEISLPGYRCPECQKSSFVPACTVCRFEDSDECPLSQLLNRRPDAVHERRGRERYRKGEEGAIEVDLGISVAPSPRRLKSCPGGDLQFSDKKKKKCQDILKQFKKNGNKVHTAVQIKKPESSSDPKVTKESHGTSSVVHPQPRPRSALPKSKTHHRSPATPAKPSITPAIPKVLPKPSEKSKSFCSQCSQAQCQTCKPGYMNLVVDMKEFSISFAGGMALCTMCEHWMCPGSSMVVLYRCRDCGHEGCSGCAAIKDECGEEWNVCCSCAKLSSVEVK